MAAPLIPIIMTGARVVIRKAPDIARALIKEGKARYAKYVSRDIDEAVTKFAGKGKGAPKLPTLASTARKKAEAALKKAETDIKNIPAATKKKVSKAIEKNKGKYLARGTKTGTSTAQARLKKATGVPTGAPKLPIGKGTKGALPTATTSKLSFARRPKGRGKRTGLREVGVAAAIAGGVGFFAGTGDTKSVTVKAGDTLSQIAKDNNTTVAAIKKANPSITNIHLIHAGQKIKVPKVKGRKSVYQGMPAAELQQPKKTTTAAKIKYGPGGYGASKTGGIVKRSAGGKVKKYTGGGTLKSTKQMTMVAIKPPPIKKSNPWGAAIKGKGKGYK
jgi:LysM repeat protein